MRLLILSSNNGAGHNSAGRALLRQAERRGVSCEMIDALALSSKAGSKALEEIHVKSALYAPQLFAWGNRMAEQMTQADKPSACYRSNARCAAKLMRYIRQNGFDTVIATHVFPALMLTGIKRTIDPGLPAYFVATDYACAPFVSETELDGWFVPHERLRWDFLKSGVPGNRLFATGIPVSSQFLAHADKAAARALLRLPQNQPVAMVMTGSMGFGCAFEQVGALLDALAQQACILLMCGNNNRLRTAVEERYGASGRVVARGYTNQIPLYMDACDVLLSKPGGLSATEAAVHGVPLVLTAPLPGCWEAENVRFFESQGLAFRGNTPESAALQAARLLGDASLRRRMQARQHAQINPFAAEDILSRVCTSAYAPIGQTCLAYEAAGAH